MKPETIQETTSLWESEPEKAQGKPSVTARSEGSQAVVEHGSFSWRVDLPPPLGGTNDAPSPTALLLSALAGCAVVFIRDTLAPQLGIRVDGIEAHAQCDADARGLLGIGGAVPDLRNFQLTFQVESPEPEAQVRKLYDTWLERCPIYLALIKQVDVATSLEVKGS